MAIKTSPLLQRLFDAGGTQNLFGLLKDWPKEDLQKVSNELDEWFAQASEALEAGRAVEIFKAENFLSDKNFKRANNTFDMAGMEIAGICGEIHSVILFYLETDTYDR